MRKTKLFVSYSHQNEDWISKDGKYKLIPWLEKQLDNQAEIWTDHTLKTLIGEEYTKLITKKVLSADIALLLISQDFVSSPYIMEVELPLIKKQYNEDKIKVLPLLLTNLTQKGKEKIAWIFDLQIYPNDVRPLISFFKDDDEWENLKVEILEGIENKIDLILHPSTLMTVDGHEENAITKGETVSEGKFANRIRENFHMDSQTAEMDIDKEGIFTDPRDGHRYKWVRIGSQIWFAENLAYKTGNGCWAYNNDQSYVNRYGYLYDWEAANKGCPKGWHLPSDDEWNILENYLIGKGCNYDGSTSGNKIGKALASGFGWTSSNVAGGVGNNQSNNNNSGFTALPGGYRGNDGFSHVAGSYGGWWSSSDLGTYYAYHRDLHYSSYQLSRDVYDKDGCLSVRCIKN